MDWRQITIGAGTRRFRGCYGWKAGGGNFSGYPQGSVFQQIRGIIMSEYTEDYWNLRIPAGTPEKVQNAIKRIYGSYPSECMPQGICDPMYILNVIALELGVGDGQGNFTP